LLLCRGRYDDEGWAYEWCTCSGNRRSARPPRTIWSCERVRCVVPDRGQLNNQMCIHASTGPATRALFPSPSARCFHLFLSARVFTFLFSNVIFATPVSLSLSLSLSPGFAADYKILNQMSATNHRDRLKFTLYRRLSSSLELSTKAGEYFSSKSRNTLLEKLSNSRQLIKTETITSYLSCLVKY